MYDIRARLCAAMYYDIFVAIEHTDEIELRVSSSPRYILTFDTVRFAATRRFGSRYQFRDTGNASTVT